MAYTDEEYRIYRKVQREFLMEDAHNFIADALAYERDVEPEDMDDDELNKFDYEALVREFLDREDCNVAFNDTWQRIAKEAVNDYLDNLEEG